MAKIKNRSAEVDRLKKEIKDLRLFTDKAVQAMYSEFCKDYYSMDWAYLLTEATFTTHCENFKRWACKSFD